MTISTTHNGNWYAVVGTVSEINNQLNIINAKVDDCVFGGNDSGAITLFVKYTGTA